MPQLSRDFGREMQRSPLSFSTALISSVWRKSGVTQSGCFSEIAEQPIFVLGEPEVVVFFDAMLDLAPFGAELAIGAALFVGQELFLPDAVVALLFVFVDLLFVVETLEHSLHAFLVQRVGRGRPAVVADFEFLPERDEFRRDLIDELLRRDPGFLGRLLHFLPVLIDTGEEKNLFALQPMISRDDVGQHLLVGVTDVWRAVGVVDGGGDVERLWHRRARVRRVEVIRNPKVAQRQQASGSASPWLGETRSHRQP